MNFAIKYYNIKCMGEFTEKKGESLDATDEENMDGERVSQQPREITDHTQALVKELLPLEKDAKLM